MNRTAAKTRLFFALLPGPIENRAIEQHAVQLAPDAGRKVGPENWHITLHFLGEVPRERVELLCLDADSIAVPAFSLSMDRSGWWEKAGIFWLGPSHCPPALLSLARQLGTIAARRKLAMEKRKYVPHLTLMRDVYRPPQGVMVEPFTWRASEFCLMQSEVAAVGVKYRALASWPLSA